jgi:hypothetical protein
MSKTVFIVGAGASYEFGLPLGSELLTQIANVLHYKVKGGQLAEVDDTMEQAYSQLTREVNGSRDITPYLDAARRITNNMPQAISIDNFIDAHYGDKHLEMCGKLAIAKCIRQAERNSPLYVQDERQGTIHFGGVPNTWLNRFVKLLTENCRLDDLESRLSTIAFVIFNYDRCVEHYLYHALHSYYPISWERAAALVGCIEIFHPYGTVGALRWQEPAQGTEFGYVPEAHHLIKIANELKTFTESTAHDSDNIKTLREHLANAKRLVFLGFAYHPQNLRLLFPAALARTHPVRIYGTAKAISASDTALISKELGDLMSFSEMNLEPVKCVELFGEFWRSLSLIPPAAAVAA